MKVCPVCHREFGAGLTHCSDDGVPLVALHTDANMRPEDLVGRIVEGRYKIERIIGKGGMGTVYACRHVVVGKVAAMKVLKTGVERSDGVLQRFVREAQTANLLRSRHIVEVSDFGQLPSGAFFVVMELLEGKDLGHAMRQGLGRPALAHVFGQVAETLEIAHEKGIVHRDLKPDNVFLVNEAGDPLFVKLLDFGIAKILHGESSGGLTETGVILGTPYYMSPEQARAESIDHRSDIYSLGVMMYRAFTGRLPFLADSTMGVLTRHITEAPEPPSKLTAIDAVTERLILRCMEKRPEHRFQSMREVADTLRSLPAGSLPELREQTTVHEGRAAPQAMGAGYGIATGTQPSVATQAPSGAYAPSGPHAPSGAYVPSGPYAPAAPSGAYPSGAHPQTASGAHAPPPQGGPYAQPTGGLYASSGAYPPAENNPYAANIANAANTSAHAARPSSPQAPLGAHDPRAQSGAYGAPPAIVGVVPRAPGPGETSTSLHNMPADAALASGETSRGLAATGATRSARGTSTATLVLGAIGMAVIGALGAFVIYLTQFARPVSAGSGAAAISTAIAAPTAATASAAAPIPAVASTPAPTASASAEPATAPAASQRPRVGGPLRKVAPVPSVPAPAHPPPGTDIRSPFD